MCITKKSIKRVKRSRNMPQILHNLQTSDNFRGRIQGQALELKLSHGDVPHKISPEKISNGVS